ncbi:proteasome complex subunit Rpn13 ubiquitin receptor-domain-containing protein [Microdochium trichocladiopsis]|uniref:Proteasome complex subunit Rpn13 ubiquitin receptor-domain-containing protein n=1 Tax=Microdochium trichocladiopsis TaxID=1682393 RepID=A0A9P8YCC3_9PEZI|nr:proteasome complex subunit Rpn13 ubiquitin receptor-domain-containing protein [Microdochium trichocladiopsis]KAH7035300.1 proteasome complex subunit Rpn13 ubiquitin receptor-domain-containing protein [Microdochium trichocladiopsis]
MSITPLITFKAGMCDVDSSSKPYKVRPDPRKGYIFLYQGEDELVHFCWRERATPIDQPELDLVMVPGDGNFLAYDSRVQTTPSAKTNGRIFVLKFSSSSQRYIFWLQSKPQGRTGDPTWFSKRDLKIGDIVDDLLQGEEIDVARVLANVDNSDNDDRRNNDDDDDDEDDAMEDVQRNSRNTPGGRGSGGAGADATGGDIRDEGEESREGGADGARAAAPGGQDAATAVRNFLDSLKGGASSGGGQGEDKLYPMLSDLLTPSSTVPLAQDASEEQIDTLLSFLPPAVLILSQQADRGENATEPTPAAIEAAKQAMSLGQKKALLQKVFRSPQFHQSLSSLTMAIRDGGLPSIADALQIKVENGGYVRRGQVPLGGGEAVEAFVEGVKRTVEEEK